MLAKIKFKKSMLAHCMYGIFNTNDLNKLLCASIFLSVCAAQSSYALETENVESRSQTLAGNTQKQLENAAEQQGLGKEKIDQIDERIKEINQDKVAVDSVEMLQQQEQNPATLNDFKPIEFEQLEELPENNVDSALVNEIFKVAEEAKVEAQNFRNGVAQAPEITVNDATQQEISEITTAPTDVKDVNELIRSIRADNKIVVEANEYGRTLSDMSVEDQEPKKEANIFKRILYSIRPAKFDTAKVERISAEVEGAPTILANNIKAKLSSFTTEAFSDFNAAVPQLRTLSNQAAQAVGYYNAKFKFQEMSENKVKVIVEANDPVLIEEQNIEFSGAGKNLAQLQVIRVLPEQDVGDILNHGAYEATKTRIVDAATNNGFFDSYWRLHDVKVKQPQNKADINLRYETGERYKLGEVEFRMSDPTKPLPIDLKVLQSMAPWKAGADYTAWRVNSLANNLTNSRYFNYTLVDAVKPDPIEKPLELPPDLQALVDQEKISEAAFADQTESKKIHHSATEVTQNVVDENQFAGANSAEMNPNARMMQEQQEVKQSETELLQEKAREEKIIPVIVTLNADRLNSLEAGIGYGTDTGVRLRGQYRRAIVNHLGHSFDANMELSQIRQSFDGRYNIPYKHPLNDYISLVGGYEREERDSIGNDMSLVIESAVAGADRIIKGSRKDWQHVFGVRYRLDRVTQSGLVDLENIPDAFLIPGANQEQESLLLGYETSKTTSDNRLNPTQGFKQSYKVQVGSSSLLTDTDMAIVNATWKGLYSLGENNDHQFVAGLETGYIFAKDFAKVPYNLRFFAGGDQSLRGFDYKSLSPEEYGYKVGGQALAIGSLEYNYQFKEGWRAAVFSDVGNAFNDKFSNDPEYSVGVGIRWKSPIGPIRLDVASGISDPDKPIRLHFFIGSQL
ncbi:autotransporter assembly complex family protein [Acinetobacter sichuanensis]|uniref:Translocation and assembly module subunit TamA n=1 Tax=Acinetobacter sichuanensis TaxID=2136183 RepID=A0A371YQT1_9GAMM|nr:autotransporter assembly complex family protein [Acinetobacter sichuanensis]RFC83826.1 outer membrane protein assembly factor [Acinetobacter sichuanensis]